VEYHLAIILDKILLLQNYQYNSKMKYSIPGKKRNIFIMKFFQRIISGGLGYLLVFLFCLGLIVPKIVNAESVTTSVTVGNSAPAFSVSPAESPASTDTSPTDVGANLTIVATATDSNLDNYYLVVCKTNAATANNSGAPTCDVGTWCTSTSTTTGNPATCSYTVQATDTAESYEWYAFVCDGITSGSACSPGTSNQGSGDSGSPFSVNHPPGFTVLGNDTPKDPGANITWTTTASDTDVATTADTVKLVVCKTAGISGGDCDGGASDRWCQSSLVASNPTCAYSIPTPTIDGANDAYAYVVDNHNLGASGGTQGTNESFTVNNIAPVVSSVALNGGVAITLTEGTTTSVALTATVTDNNSCTDISTVEGFLYRSAITYAGCDTALEGDDNYCYPEVSCSVSGGNTCDGTSDASASYSCTVSVQYFADPTDANTEYPTENWLNTILATDDDAATDSLEVSTGVELNSLVAMDITASINYGNLSIGQSNDPLDKITTVSATGNVGLDEELSGTNMTDGGSGTITVDYQKYALASSTAYASGIALSGVATEVELNVAKTISLTPETANTYWGLEIPAGTTPGEYSGTNTVTAVKGEIVNW
jgi:hypothetical protein